MATGTKRLLALILALILCISMLPAAALAEEDGEAGTIALAEEPGEEPQEGVIAPAPEDQEALPPAEGIEAVYSGQCGDDLTWSFDEDTGVLTVSGTGPMWDFEWYTGEDSNLAPWFFYQGKIVALIVEPGITAIGARAFNNQYSLQSVELADTVQSIGPYAFSSCNRLTEFHVPDEVKVLQNGMFSLCMDLTTVYLPAGLEQIRSSVFDGCGRLKDVYYAGTVADWIALSAAIEDRCNYWLHFAAIHCTDGDIIPEDDYHCGDDAAWTLENGVLTISGTGSTWDMLPGRWYEMRDQITRIVVEEGITELNRYCFNGLDRVTSVSLPRSLTGIRQGAFNGMSSLETLDIPEGLQVFEHEVFGDTGLRSVKVPSDWTVLPARTFMRCRNLTAVELPEGLTAIRTGVFEGDTALERIVIPSSVTCLGSFAFEDCTGLRQIWFMGTAPALIGGLFSDEDDAVDVFENVSATAYYPADDPSWTEEVRQGYGGDLTWVPYATSGECGDALTWSLDNDVLAISGTGDMWNWSWEAPPPWFEMRNEIHAVEIQPGVTNVGNFAFAWSHSIESVTLPEGVTVIGYRAFESDARLDQITLPEGLTSIRSRAFLGCDALSSITIPASVRQIDLFSLNSCQNMTQILVAEGNADFSSYDGVLYNKDRTRLIQCPGGRAGDFQVPDTVTYIGDGAFWDCKSITGIRIPSSVTQIVDNPFSDDVSLRGFEVAQDNSAFCSEDGVLYSKDMRLLVACPGGRSGTLTVPEGVTATGEMAIGYCPDLTEVIFPEGMTEIGSYSLSCCSSLRSVTIPASMGRIADGAFSGCGALETVRFTGTRAQWQAVEIGNNNEPLLEKARIICSDGAVGYSGQCGDELTWTLDEVTGILTVSGTGAMWDYNSTSEPWSRVRDQIRKVVLEPGVTGVGICAFLGCRNLTEIVLPEGLTRLGQFCFRECPSLIKVDLPASLETIEQGVLSECTKLIAVNAAPGGNFKTVDGVLFTADGKILMICPGGLSDVYQVPEGVTEINTRAFYGCRRLTGILLPDSVTTLGSNAFQRCSSLLAVNIPDGVETLGVSTFYDCTSLQSLTIPASVTLIWNYSFCNCTGLRSIRFLGSAPEICWEIGSPNLFTGVTATAYYPADDSSWTEELRESYGGDLTWTPWQEGILSGRCGEQVYWSLDSDGTMTISGTGDMWDFEWDYDQKRSTAPWTVYSASIRRLVVGRGVTGIGNEAFDPCVSLTEVELPESLLRIGEFALQKGCFREIRLPSRLREIGEGAFLQCARLDSVTIPAGVTSIGSMPFGYCGSLERVGVDPNNASFSERDGMICNKAGTVLMICPGGRSGVLTVPGVVTEIADYAVYTCSKLTGVTIPAAVTDIGEGAFAGCYNASEIRFKGKAPAIGQYAFLSVAATAYYPEEDASWTEEVRQNYGGRLTWVPYTPNPFCDVQEGKYYYAPVLWAISQDPPITSGTGEGTFSPNQTCTRAQIVTFIWNAFGQPEPSGTNNPFEDMPEGKWYTKAVLWAVEKGITSGVDATHFGPNKNCTRAQVVTFLWNAYGKPEPTSTVNPFKDVKEGKYYYKAVLWAVENGITSGMSADTFGTDRTCTRGQVVTFLYNTKDIPKPV